MNHIKIIALGVCLLFSGIYTYAEIETDSINRIHLQVQLRSIIDSLSLDNSKDYQQRMQSKDVDILQQLYQNDDIGLAEKFSELSEYNYSIGNYEEAIRLGTEALSIREKVLGKEHPDYAWSLHNLAGNNDATGNYAEAILPSKHCAKHTQNQNIGLHL